MGKLIGLIVVVAVLWGGWWAIASFGLERGFSTWVKERGNRGWQIDIGEAEKLGFPLRLQTRVSDVSVKLPATSPQRTTLSAFDARRLDLSTPAYWRGHITAATPFAQMEITGPFPDITIGVEDVIADIRLRPSLDLELDRVSLKSGEWTATGRALGTIEGKNLDIAMIQRAPRAAVYDINLDARGVTLQRDVRTLLGLPETWPDAFQTLNGKMTVTFDKPWNRHAKRPDLPQPQRVQLHHAEISWGDVGVLGNVDLAVNANGLATGTVSVQVKDWPTLLNMVDAAGYLPLVYRPQAEQILKSLAQMDGKTSDLDLTISLTDGRISMGFIPLGRARRVILR
jgi:hypothetical protein